MDETIKRLRFLLSTAQTVGMSDEALLSNLKDVLQCETNEDILTALLNRHEDEAKLQVARRALDVFRCELRKLEVAIC